MSVAFLRHPPPLAFQTPHRIPHLGEGTLVTSLFLLISHESLPRFFPVCAIFSRVIEGNFFSVFSRYLSRSILSGRLLFCIPAPLGQRVFLLLVSFWRPFYL